MAYFHVCIVESAGSQANGGNANGPTDKVVAASGEETVTDGTKKTQTLTSTAADVGKFWRIAVIGTESVYAECATSPAFTSSVNAPLTARLLPPGLVEYVMITAAGKKWAVITA